MKAWSNAKRPNFPAVWGYTRAEAASMHTMVVENEKLLSDYFEANPEDHADIAWGGFYRDAPSTALMPILQRPAGTMLSAMLWKGDHVLVSKLDLAFASFKDFRDTLARWRSRGVTLHVVSLGLVLPPDKEDVGHVLVNGLDAFMERMRWHGADLKRAMEIEPERLAETITELEGAGKSPRAIIATLNARCIATPSGGRWTTSILTNWIARAKKKGLLGTNSTAEVKQEPEKITE